MKFRVLPVHSAKDATENFEQLQGALTVREESVAVAYLSAAQKIPSGAFTRVKVNKAVADPGGHLNLTEGWYTASTEGWYQVTFTIGVTINVLGTVLVSSVGVNGTEKARGNRVTQEAAGTWTVGSLVSGLVHCELGDKIEPLVFQNSGAEKETEALEVNRFSVVKVA